jgi:streptogramin lyase
VTLASNFQTLSFSHLPWMKIDLKAGTVVPDGYFFLALLLPGASSWVDVAPVQYQGLSNSATGGNGGTGGSFFAFGTRGGQLSVPPNGSAYLVVYAVPLNPATMLVNGTATSMKSGFTLAPGQSATVSVADPCWQGAESYFVHPGKMTASVPNALANPINSAWQGVSQSCGATPPTFTVTMPSPYPAGANGFYVMSDDGSGQGSNNIQFVPVATPSPSGSPSPGASGSPGASPSPSASASASASPGASASGTPSPSPTPRSVSSVTLALSPASLPAGTAAVTTLTVVPKDAAGQVISSGSLVDALGNPVTLTVAKADTGGSGTTTPAATAFTNPAQMTTTITYNGGSLYSSAYSVTSNRTLVGSLMGATLSITGTRVIPYSTGVTGGGLPAAITVGPDHNLWFAEYSGSRIGRATTNGVVTEYSAGITVSSAPAAIAVGSDNNLWFTEYNTSKIGRITTAGTVTEFTGLTGGGAPAGITAGPDQNLWFTEYNASRIGKISPGGTVTEYTLAGGSQPVGIAQGSDGNLWFTEYGTAKIGRITTAGAVTEFGASAGAGPWEITAGPDGNLWFTEYTGQRIGRITTNGTVTEYSSGISAGCNPNWITSGPDGNLWFTEQAGARIGRITTSGTITEFATGFATGAAGITSGPDGNLWFGLIGLDGLGTLIY